MLAADNQWHPGGFRKWYGGNLDLEELTMRWFRKPREMTYWERREQAFIDAVNQLKTLHVTSEGAMSTDPGELREQVMASREQLKHLVKR